MKKPSGHQSRTVLPIGMVASVLLCGWSGQDACAQTNSSRTADSRGRYLVIVETSRPMEPRVEGVRRAVQSVLNSTLGKELRNGASIGTWTYNETLNSGRFPLQEWSAGAKNNAVAAITDFLGKEKYQKKPHVDKVMPALARVIANSPALTVILISSGTEDIRGTPFDEQLNRTFKQWREEQRQTRQPFVTIFRAAQGKMTSYAVAAAPWPLEVPPLPELPMAKLAQTNAAPKAARPVPVLPPLIVSGRKPQPAQTNPVPPATVGKVIAAGAATEVASGLAVPAPTNALIATVTEEPVKAQPAAGTTPAPAPTATPVPKSVAAAVSNAPVIGGQTAAEEKSPADEQPQSSTTARNPTADLPPPAAKATEPAIQAASANAPSIAETPIAAASQLMVAAAPTQPRATLNRALTVGASGVLAVGLAWFWWSRNRARATRPISLITRSLDRR